MTKPDYQTPVSQLLGIGENNDNIWPEYSEYGITAEHIPELIRLATSWEDREWSDDDPGWWGPLHAWHALKQLEAVEAIEPLIGLFYLVDEEDDEWVAEELPVVLGEIGATAITPLGAYLTNDAHGTWARLAASEALVYVARAYPDSRLDCIHALTAALENFEQQDEGMNGTLVIDLIHLDAVEAAPLLEKAYAAEKVDLFAAGDWEDVQVELGLLEKRITPEKREPFLFSPSKKSTSVLSQPQQSKKSENSKRKQAKQSRKKNRKKK